MHMTWQGTSEVHSKAMRYWDQGRGLLLPSWTYGTISFATSRASHKASNSREGVGGRGVGRGGEKGFI